MNEEERIFFKETNHKFEMISVPGGSITLSNGSKHKVTPFLLGETPVTQALYEHIMGFNPSYFIGKNRPVEYVNWFDALQFCNKLSEKIGKRPYYYHDEALMIPFGKKGDQYKELEEDEFNKETSIVFDEAANGFRLPTEAEWEFAANGGKEKNDFEYAGGNDLEDVGWYDANSHEETKPVKLKKENDLGLYDISGNVWEWCWDWYDEDRSFRVPRGGGWDSRAGRCRPSLRSSAWPTSRSSIIGFRLALSPPS